MAIQVINLDELIPEGAAVIFKGERHEVVPASTEMYLEVLKQRDKVKHANEQIEQVEQSILLIRMSCPTIPEKDLRRLPLKALMALTKLIEGFMEDINEGKDKPDGDALGE